MVGVQCMVNQITNLGMGGFGPWFIQRVSAVILAAYLIFMAGFVLSHAAVTYDVWRGLYAGLGMKVFSLATLLSLLSHAWIGIWTVVTDYMHGYVLRLTVMLIVIAGLFASLVWGVQLLWSV